MDARKALNIHIKHCLVWEQVHIQQHMFTEDLFMDAETLDHWPLSIFPHA